jgi:uncharacterized membrane protein YhhN
LVKTVSTGALALLALIGALPVLAMALALSATGDFALSKRGERWFMAGLVAFALAHAVYIFLLIGGGWPPITAMVLLGALAVSTLWWLLPFTAELRIPVAIYVLLITGMGLAAWGHDSWLLRLGATMFIASDVILARQIFRADSDVTWHKIALWVLYYAGQVALMAGLS